VNNYVIGSKVVHPCYGAGIIVGIQQKNISEATHYYYVIDTTARSMKLLVPVQQAQSIGLRDVGDENKLRNVLQNCATLPAEGDILSDLRARQTGMREKLKSGRYPEVADVVRMLFYMNSRRPLGTIDRQLFDQGKEFLAGELALASGRELQVALQEVEDFLARMFTAN
jgi:CarD family transcriptional regulator